MRSTLDLRTSLLNGMEGRVERRRSGSVGGVRVDVTTSVWVTCCYPERHRHFSAWLRRMEWEGRKFERTKSNLLNNVQSLSSSKPTTTVPPGGFPSSSLL